MNIQGWNYNFAVYTGEVSTFVNGISGSHAIRHNLIS